jgi:hypothetical protein
MSATHFHFTTPKFFLFRNRSNLISIPQCHILILFWCALVILYDVTGLRLTP